MSKQKKKEMPDHLDWVEILLKKLTEGMDEKSNKFMGEITDFENKMQTEME